MFKWSFGEPQEKSLRATSSAAAVGVSSTKLPLPTMDILLPPEEDNICLLTNTKEKCAEIVRLKDKEELYQKINSREPIAQMGLNPFHTSRYMDDIAIQDKYLRR